MSAVLKLKPKPPEDELAKVVLERYRRARRYREDYIVHQNMSYERLMQRADRQYRREYTSEDAAEMNEAFGFVPTRYLGIVQQKVNATVAWANDLIINNIDAMFTVNASPKPDLDQASLDNIRDGVRLQLRQRMMDAGIADPRLLLDANGQPGKRIKDYLQDQVRALKQIETASIVSLASSQAKVAQVDMRETMVNGGFRQAYAAYTFDRALYGVGYVKFPDWQRRPTLEHSGPKAKIKWKIMPWFRHVRVLDFYPICDAIDLQTNTGNTERTHVTKAELIGLASNKKYNASQITKVLEEFAYTSRNWLDSDPSDIRRENWWELDETIPLLTHEGFFTGDELAKHGVTGVAQMDYVSARIDVCGMRIIRCELLSMPGGYERSYYGAPFAKIGTNLLDVLGMGAMLWDSEQRANRVLYLFEHNIDWASRPPGMVNPSAFENPNDARMIRPGEFYNVEDRFATSGSMPEPIRPMTAISAQYHLIMTQLGAILRMADEDCGIPAFAYGSQDMGKSSLGEFSQRMSNALRTIKQSALNEDLYFIEPAFKGLFNYKATTEPDFADGNDIHCLIRGMTGLLQEDIKMQRQNALFPNLILLAQQGVVPPIAMQYVVRNLLEQAGFPVDSLGMTDPQIDHAVAVATGTPTPGVTPGGPQVPQLDGRSNVPPQNVATPSGASQFSIPSPSMASI